MGELLRHTGAELAHALAEQCLGVIGTASPTDEQTERLADSLIAHAAKWSDLEFNLGLQYSEEEPAEHKRDILLTFCSNPDAALNALHQAGWKVVPRG